MCVCVCENQQQQKNANNHRRNLGRKSSCKIKRAKEEPL